MRSDTNTPPTASSSEGRERVALSRRSLLLGTSAVAVAMALPVVPAAPAVAKVVAPPLPTWIVGTPGEWDHEVIRAATREAAIAFRAEGCEFEDDPDEEEGLGGENCGCEDCTARSGYMATRVPQWDGRPLGSIGGGDWLDIGNETICSRCDYETAKENGGHNVKGKAVCEDCMTLADWDIVDSERAAELRAEQEDALASLLPTGQGEKA